MDNTCHKCHNCGLPRRPQCLYSHSQNGLSYEWLEVLGHGKVIRVWFEEPVGSGDYKLYDDKWWETHCRVVSHGDNLLEAHIKSFVDKDTRFARMMFLFEDDTLMEANEDFYILEDRYFNQ